MAGSLREQLIKAGLATSGQGRKAERQVKAEKQAQGRPKPDREPAKDVAARPKVISEAERRHAEKVERDRELARIANEKAMAKARKAEIRQIIQQNDQRTKPPADDDVPYNFLHGKKVKRIYVTREHQAQLSAGNLAIANNEGRYHLVSIAVAEQIRARDPNRIIAAHDNRPPAPSADDEYYAKFKVPDDLDW